MLRARRDSQETSQRLAPEVSGRRRIAGCSVRWPRLRFSLPTAMAYAPMCAQASIFKGEALDKAADIIAIVVLCIVPLAVITLFWLVHVLPEKIAERRHHPQQTAIKTLCLLSLVFGGLLWPLAWLWAYTKPIGYKLAYGTDKHENYFIEAGERAEKGELAPAELEALEQELDGLAARDQLPPELRAVRARLAALRAPTLTQPQPIPPQPSPLGRTGGSL